MARPYTSKLEEAAFFMRCAMRGACTFVLLIITLICGANSLERRDVSLEENARGVYVPLLALAVMWYLAGFLC